MQTLKTALVVVALLAVLLVAYQSLNNQKIELPFKLGGGTAPEAANSELAGVMVEAPPLNSWAPPSTALASEGISVADSSRSSMPLSEAPPQRQYGLTGAEDDATKLDERVAPAGLGDSVPAQVAPAVALTPATDAENAGEAASSYAPNTPTGYARLANSPSMTSPLREPPSTTVSPVANTPEESQPRYASPATARYAFEQAWHKAETEISDGQLARALLTLSEFYRHPDLDAESQTKLDERLDQLAGTVIYSTRHLLEPPHKVLRGERLEEIAARYQAPVRLLQNINGLRDPGVVLPGTELKVLRGPLRAEVDLTRGELTIFLGGLYAGRFSVQPGADPAPRAGEYQVQDIQPGRAYYSASGQPVPADNPANPYGSWWIDLGRDMCIHGSPETGAAPGSGCLALNARDATDVAAILSLGSKVLIRE